MLFSLMLFFAFARHSKRVTLFSFTLHIYTIGKLVLYKPPFQLLCVCLSRRTYDDIFAAIHIFLTYTILIKKSPKIDQNQHHLWCRWTISGKRFFIQMKVKIPWMPIFKKLQKICSKPKYCEILIFLFTKSSLHLIILKQCLKFF